MYIHAVSKNLSFIYCVKNGLVSCITFLEFLITILLSLDLEKRKDRSKGVDFNQGDPKSETREAKSLFLDPQSRLLWTPSSYVRRWRRRGRPSNARTVRYLGFKRTLEGDPGRGALFTGVSHCFLKKYVGLFGSPGSDSYAPCGQICSSTSRFDFEVLAT